MYKAIYLMGNDYFEPIHVILEKELSGSNIRRVLEEAEKYNLLLNSKQSL